MDEKDANALAEAARRCLMASMDGTYSIQQQVELNAKGKRLRGAWVNLVSARFNSPESLQMVADMTALLSDVNKDLAAKASAAQAFTNMMKNVNKALGFADQLLELATKFA